MTPAASAAQRAKVNGHGGATSSDNGNGRHVAPAGAAISVTDNELGPEPIPLDSVVVPRLPDNVFTGWFGDQTDAVAHSTETPRELAGMFGLATIGVVCQKRFSVRLEPNYIEPTNIWTLTTLESGNRKTARSPDGFKAVRWIDTTDSAKAIIEAAAAGTLVELGLCGACVRRRLVRPWRGGGSKKGGACPGPWRPSRLPSGVGPTPATRQDSARGRWRERALLPSLQTLERLAAEGETPTTGPTISRATRPAGSPASGR